MKKIDPLTLILTFVLVTPTGYLLAGPTSSATTSQEYLPDSAITEQVQSALDRDTSMLSAPLQVATYRGIVHLGGSVYTEEQLAQAENIASHVEGVREVRSHLHVKQATRVEASEAVAGL